MDGAIINCMGMAMENVLARPVSAISRNSDDFVPGKEEGFSEHLCKDGPGLEGKQERIEEIRLRRVKTEKAWKRKISTQSKIQSRKTMTS